MKERPILFNGEMVRAILDGRKTQTLRPRKPQPIFLKELNGIGYCGMSWSIYKGKWGLYLEAWPHLGRWGLASSFHKCPYGEVGNRFWVRETFDTGYSIKVENKDPYFAKHMPEVIYRADNPVCCEPIQWKPSIHMPRRASRITLEITDIRVERVQDISCEDAMAEGDPGPLPQGQDSRQWFWQVWDEVYGKKYPWKDNPWVWVIDFKRMK